VEKTLKKTRTTLVFSVDKPKVDGNIVDGYFSDADNELVITTKDCWPEILVHEFCHYLQWIEKCKYWTNLDIDDTNCLDLMWKWINHEIELSKAKRKIVFSRIRDMELDCERRTVELIKKYNLPINLKEYICFANVYIYYYNFARVTRKWFPDEVSPMTMDKVHSLMPKSLEGKRNKMSEEMFNTMALYFS
jgi:hypothetical protein